MNKIVPILKSCYYQLHKIKLDIEPKSHRNFILKINDITVKFPMKLYADYNFTNKLVIVSSNKDFV